MAIFRNIAIVNRSDKLIRVHVASGNNVSNIASAWGPSTAPGQNYRDFDPGMSGIILTDVRPPAPDSQPSGQGYLVITAAAYDPPAPVDPPPFPPLSSVAAHHRTVAPNAVVSIIATISGSGGQLNPIDLQVEEG